MTTSEEEGVWALIALETDAGPRIYRMRAGPPAGVKKEIFAENVIVEWRYDGGMPDEATAAAMFALQELIEPLDDHTKHSVLMHVFTGTGMKEWCFYTRSYDDFMKALNVALRGKPRFPIEILHDSDPGWEYWSNINDYANGK